jgi:hypothetical protein
MQYRDCLPQSKARREGCSQGLRRSLIRPAENPVASIRKRQDWSKTLFRRLSRLAGELCQRVVRYGFDRREITM